MNIKLPLLLSEAHLHFLQKMKEKANTVGVNKNVTLFIHELLSLQCISFKNLWAHHQEEVLGIPKQPLLSIFQ